MNKIQVGFLVSYDYELLKNAIPPIYEDSDTIFLAIDKNRKTWKGSDIAIDESRLRNMLDDDRCGAFVSFEGRVRNHNNATSVERLSYYGYEELAINQGRQIIEEAKSKFEITHAIAIHRIGALEVGDIAVWIGVVSAHRYPAFDACRWILDTIKADIPVWKQEYYEGEPSKWLSNNG